MNVTFPLLSCGHEIDSSPEAFGEIRSSADCLERPDELRQRLAVDGYLYVPGFFSRDLILAARASVTARLAAEGSLDPAFPVMDAIGHPDKTSGYRGDLAVGNPEVARVVYGPELVAFYTALFGEPVRHFDYTWFRAMSRGQGSTPHCDLVYMGRGTHQLLTCWIPYGDVPLEVGGVMLLEDSHKKSERLRHYLEIDVDSYCENRPREVERVKNQGGWSHPGFLTKNPVSLREKLGGRWLTAPEWRIGDFITFGMSLVHGSLDNQTARVRLSSDTRYQRASEPIDERWIGANPIANTRAGKRGRVC
ncbi:phytanoyl-CoA dioxygenase family protein [Horticoccus luteus]|uniref:Phytanoyl-CoA dioxygenase family protein n=1 Tax=Horticoccus luteus TaxID=2862869 RepID=A0A8F9TWT2_9BACT|nr:phytanoyl-CoA dioxygenase family protein [Horticoccus luteus]QYM80581.1 phytanoyl-CoA dioxygenase family protein [Horticoccus luteus]